MSLTEQRESLPFVKVTVFAVVATVVLAGVFRLITGGGPPSELLQRYEWERVGKMFVYIEPAAVEDAEFLRGVADKLRDADWCRFLFFDDRAHTPAAYPLTDEQTRHYRAKYEANAMQNVEKLVWIDVVDPDRSPPGYIERDSPPATWVRSPRAGGGLRAFRERAKHSGMTTEVRRASAPSTGTGSGR